MKNNQAQITLYIVMLISFLGTAGIALPYPVLAPYFLDYPPNELTHFLGLEPKLLLGIALAVYPLGMLIGGSFIGALSDLYGRRRILIITLIGTAISYLVTAYAVNIHSFVLFILARLIAGICEGNVAIARAMAADLHPHVDKTRAMSLLFATVYAGWLFGPLAGGYLMPLGVDWVFAFGALATVATLVVVMLFIRDREVRPEENRTLLKIIIQENSFALLQHRVIWPLFSFYMIYTLAINLFYEYYPVWLVERLSYNSEQIAWMTVIITAFMILSSVIIATAVIKRLGRYLSLIGGVTVVAVSMIMIAVASEVIVYILFAVMGMMIAINNSVTPAYMSDRFEHFGQGKVMGLQTSLFFLANVIMAIAGSFIAIVSVDAIMYFAGLLMLVSLVWLFASGETTYLKSEQIIKSPG